MTIPWKMNCSHSGEGWCLECVSEMGDELVALRELNDCLKQTIRQMERFVPVSVTCSECDADEGELKSLREIRAAGWVDVEFDDGPSWNFIGTCPECAKKEGGAK